jgi:hypothetical protein
MYVYEVRVDEVRDEPIGIELESVEIVRAGLLGAFLDLFELLIFDDERNAFQVLARSQNKTS